MCFKKFMIIVLVLTFYTSLVTCDPIAEDATVIDIVDNNITDDMLEEWLENLHDTTGFLLSTHSTTAFFQALDIDSALRTILWRHDTIQIDTVGWHLINDKLIKKIGRLEKCPPHTMRVCYDGFINYGADYCECWSQRPQPDLQYQIKYDMEKTLEIIIEIIRAMREEQIKLQEIKDN